MEMGDVAVLPSSSHEEDVFVTAPVKDIPRAPQSSQEHVRVPRIPSFSRATNNQEANHNAQKKSPKFPSSSPRDNDLSSPLSPYTPPGSPGTSYSGPRVINKIRTIGNYVVERTIGRGQFGKVKLAYHKRVPEMKVAIKIINKTKLDEDTLRMIQREVKIMKLMNHPHIIKLYEVIETPKMFFLIMEYAEGGEVMDFIIAHGRIPEKEARRFFIQMLSAVEYCHSKHCVHRDLKPENLLLDSNMNVKIIDFGLSNVFSPGSLLKTFCGSPTYASPELILRKEYFGPAVDVWSMGVVLYVLVCGYLPFDGHNFNELFHKILKVQYTIPSHVSADCATLIRRMLVVEPAQRITIEEIRQRTWLGPLSGYLPSTVSSDIDDLSRVDKETVAEMVNCGYNADDVAQSLLNNRYDDAAAMYHLLESKRKRKNSLKTTFSYEKLSSSARESHVEPKEVIPPAIPTVPVPRFKRGHRRNNTVDACSSPEETPKHTNPPPAPIVVREREDSITKEKSKGFHMRTLIRAGHTPPRGKNHRRAASEAMKEEMIQQAKQGEPLTLEPAKANPTPAPHSPPQQIVEDDWVLLGGSGSGDHNQHHASEQKPTLDEEEATMARSPSKSTVSSIFSSIKSMWKHKAPTNQQPRVVRFAFTLNTTSDKSAEQIIQEVQRVLHEYNIRYTMKSSFIADCVVDNVRFSVEVCRLPRLLVNGIRLSRISGSAWKYKTIAKDFMAQLKL